MLLKHLDWSFIQFLDRLDWINRKFSGTSLKEDNNPHSRRTRVGRV